MGCSFGIYTLILIHRDLARKLALSSGAPAFLSYLGSKSTGFLVCSMHMLIGNFERGIFPKADYGTFNCFFDELLQLLKYPQGNENESGILFCMNAFPCLRKIHGK